MPVAVNAVFVEPATASPQVELTSLSVVQAAEALPQGEWTSLNMEVATAAAPLEQMRRAERMTWAPQAQMPEVATLA